MANEDEEKQNKTKMEYYCTKRFVLFAGHSLDFGFYLQMNCKCGKDIILLLFSLKRKAEMHKEEEERQRDHNYNGEKN